MQFSSFEQVVATYPRLLAWASSQQLLDMRPSTSVLSSHRCSGRAEEIHLKGPKDSHVTFFSCEILQWPEAPAQSPIATPGSALIELGCMQTTGCSYLKNARCT